MRDPLNAGEKPGPMRRFARRRFLSSLASLGALAACGPVSNAPLLGNTHGASTRRRGASGMTLTIANKTGSYKNDEIYFYNLGTNAAGMYYHELADGTLAQCELSDNGPSGYADYSIPLAKKGTTSIAFPPLSGRVYFSIGAKLKIAVVQTGSTIGLQLPAGWNKSDPNYFTLFDWLEYSLGTSSGFNGNTTMVDMFGIPITIELVGQQTQSSGTLVDKGRSNIFTQIGNLKHFSKLIVKHKGTDLRVIAPGHGIDEGIFPSNYLDSEINSTWQYYQKHSLSVTTNYGTAVGTVNDSDQFVFTRDSQVVATIAIPSTEDVFYCNGTLAAPNNEDGAIAAIIGAGLNRSILQGHTSQADCKKTAFYVAQPTNSYSAVMHANTKKYNCYGFAFDDVCGYSSDLSDPEPTALHVTLGSFD
jgi:Beta-1,3-glucanase